MDIKSLLESLSRKRALFHSEADFQHALAWEIHLSHSDAKIRLEYCPSSADQRMYVDLWIVSGDGAISAIELKYKTRKIEHALEDGEIHKLRQQGAQDQGRYDFLKDVSRLEKLTAANPRVAGTAIFLTNDSGYWSLSSGSDSVDAAFRIHEGRALAGTLDWGKAASAGTKSGRKNAIELSAKYHIGWTDYSNLSVKRAGVFRYARIDVVAGTAHVVPPGDSSKRDELK